jgi:hypothetical protein
MSEAGKKTLLLEQGGPSYYITGGRERPGWLNGTDLSRVDVPGLYKSIFVSRCHQSARASEHFSDHVYRPTQATSFFAIPLF